MHHHNSRWTLSAIALAVLSGCASYDLEQGLKQVNQQTRTFAGADVSLARSDQVRAEHRHVAQELLKQPLTQAGAVRLMLANSPSFQALIARQWAMAADSAQSGRISNPVFALERVVTGAETELTRILSFGLLDVLTLPARASVAEQRAKQAQLQLAAGVVDQVTQVRQSWVDAVGAQQSLTYAKQIHEVAQAGAELAKRMEAAGNFNRLTRSRHQALQVEARMALVLAQQQALASREALVRLLGLDESQAQQLQLPDHLPDVPALPLSTEQVAKALSQERLDVQMAQAQWRAAAKAQGLKQVTSLTDVELTYRRGSVNDGAGSVTHPRGYELGVRLPLFDSGHLLREGMNARTLQATAELETTLRAASSHVRESYGAYRAAYDITRHFMDEVLPLQQTMADENLLRYNGMIIGVFELMDSARLQMNAVKSAIEAQQQFWRADAALQATLMGRPTGAVLSSAVSTSRSETAAGH